MTYKKDLSILERVYPKYENSKLTEFIQPTFVNEYVNLSNFNYEGKCREPFRYKQNNEKDLVFTAIKYQDIDLWEKDNKSIKFVSDMMKNTIPNAKKVCVIYDNFDELSKFIRECGFEPIEVKLNNETLKNTNAAIDRFLQLDQYLKKHEGQFERIALIDFRDVLFFADGFQTISEDEVVFTQECIGIKNNHILYIDYRQSTNYNWIKNIYGKEIANSYRKENKFTSNVGVIIGGFKPFKQLLDVFIEEINKKKDFLHIWGVDNAMINYLLYSGKFSGINVVVNTFTQRLAFNWDLGFNYNKANKSITDLSDGCSPIIRHKMQGKELFSFGDNYNIQNFN